jgi:uncharacterized protein YbjT (DUF2867 family)
MYAVTGITGKVGGALARALLACGQQVRAVVRDADRAASWRARGCQIAIADMEDESALATAFHGATGVFILPPSEFDPAPGFPEAKAVIDAVANALRLAKPKKVVCLSTIGAHATESNLLTQRTLMEQMLTHLSMPITFLRPGWFLENSAWDVAAARDAGRIASFLQPLDRVVPMVATEDVGSLAAKLLQETWTGVRVVEIEGPHRVSPNDIAAAFSRAFGHPVQAEVVERSQWKSMFKSQGMRNPMPRIRMLDGFNEGWICFEGSPENVIRGQVDLDTVIKKLVADAS